MDQTRFQEAKDAYAAGDYRVAAKGFLACAGRGAEGNGLAYHMAGNSLLHLRRHQDAVTVYGHALRDPVYDKRGAVWANLGASYVAIGEYAEAVRAYESALSEPDYATPYKAYQGMAGALMERGRVEEAAVAYRKAALDPGNPDPGKSLVNLGLCFMALGRPSDAVDAYQAALGFDEYKGRGKALANLGQAYTALGEYEEAVRTFEKATQLHGHALAPAAADAYATAKAQSASGRQVVEGWETGEIPAADLPVASQTAGWEPTGVFDAELLPEIPAAPGDHAEAEQAAAQLGFGDDEAVADFFSVTEEELKVRDREARRVNRGERVGGRILRTFIVLAVIVVLAGAGLVGAFYMGFGWPTQSQSVSGMLEAHGSGKDVTPYWVAVPDKDVAKEMAKIPPIKTFTVDGVVRAAQTSTVTITVTPKSGAPLHYRVTLTREGVGWKVSGVENDWRSTGG